MSLKSASVNDIKKELHFLENSELITLCLQLTKYKKDNKEFLDYLLFHSNNLPEFTNSIKEEIDILMKEVSSYSNLHNVKKGLRKILKLITKYSKYINSKATSVELLIHFCKQLKKSGIPYKNSQLLVNMYAMQLKKIEKLITELHEDYQMDYETDLQFIRG
jgi:hypothetical protein